MPLLWQLLGIVNKKLFFNRVLYPMWYLCASGPKADIYFYIVRFTEMEMSILGTAQRAQSRARFEF